LATLVRGELAGLRRLLVLARRSARGTRPETAGTAGRHTEPLTAAATATSAAPAAPTDEVTTERTWSALRRIASRTLRRIGTRVLRRIRSRLWVVRLWIRRRPLFE